MKPNAIVDSAHQLDQFHCLVHRQQDTAREIREKLLHSDDTALTVLGSETQDLLTEITRLVTNAPVDLHTHFGDQVFEDMHRDVATAVTISTSTPLEAAEVGWRRERLSTSVQLAVFILDTLSGGEKPVVFLAENEKVKRKNTSQFPLHARLPASRVERAKRLYVAKMGATRL